VPLNADRNNIDFTADDEQQRPIEGTGWLDIKVSGPVGMQVNASGAGMFKQANLMRTVRMAQA
jgi:hypothetical protein